MISFKILLLTLIFTIFLWPFSLEIDGSGVSVNYLFLIYPIIIIFTKNKIIIPSKLILYLIIISVLIFIISSIIDFDNYIYIDRRIVSFIIFIGTFSYTFIRVDCEMEAAFKNALVLVSLFLVYGTLYRFLEINGELIGNGAKSLVGSQRYGFIYIFTFWIIYLYKSKGMFESIIKWFLIISFLAGVLLTFSRSSIISLLFSFFIYAAYSINNISNIFSNKNIKYIVINIFLFITIIAILYWLIPSTFRFYEERLFSLTNGSGQRVYNLADPSSSEGFRVQMLYDIFNFVIINSPFLGSGFLGVWSMQDAIGGSAHVQYADTFFRIGLVGIIVYITLLWKLTIYLRRYSKTYFYGFIGVLAYGFFHETFKESQGAFLLAFLLGSFQTGMIDRVRTRCK